MLLSFLRLFPKFRDLSALAEAQARNCEVAEAEATRLRELAAETAQEMEDLTNQLRSSEADLFAARASGEDLTKTVARLKVKLKAALADKEHLWELANTALEGERYALHTQVNHATQRASGGVPYPDANTLPADRVATLQRSGPIGRRGRILPSEVMARQERKNVEAWAEAMAGSRMEAET